MSQYLSGLSKISTPLDFGFARRPVTASRADARRSPLCRVVGGSETPLAYFAKEKRSEADFTCFMVNSNRWINGWRLITFLHSLYRVEAIAQLKVGLSGVRHDVAIIGDGLPSPLSAIIQIVLVMPGARSLRRDHHRN